jgi:hypothetical protein
MQPAEQWIICTVDGVTKARKVTVDRAKVGWLARVEDSDANGIGRGPGSAIASLESALDAELRQARRRRASVPPSALLAGLFALVLSACSVPVDSQPETHADPLAGYELSSFAEQYPSLAHGCVTVWVESGDCRLLGEFGDPVDCASGEDVTMLVAQGETCHYAMNHGCSCASCELDVAP